MAQKRHGFLLASVSVGVAVSAVALAILAASVGKSWPHDALPTAAMPKGWSYPFNCCSGFDCREVPDKAIVEGARGYEIRATAELIPMSDPRIKESPMPIRFSPTVTRARL